MCAFDWGLFATVVTAVATIGVVVGAFAAVYAYRTAMAAIETLRLEAEPIIIAGVRAPQDELPNWTARVETNEKGDLLILPASANGKESQADFTIKNVGRSAAMNVTAYFIIRGIASTRNASFPVFIESLTPQETVVVRVRNATSTAISVTVDRATKASVLKKGAIEEAPLFLSSALPFAIG